MPKTPRSADPRFDVASAMAMGRRDYQEDALATDFPVGADMGLVVLADGMGGHAAGDIASRLVVGRVFSELKVASEAGEGFAEHIPQALRAATDAGNAAIRAHWMEHSEARGMGTTLVALVFTGNDLYWLSVGDSPLLLYRKGTIRRLNEDHSLAPQIDYLVLTGQMDPEIGRNHPDRSCLTSVLGGDRIERIDCTQQPLTLLEDDIIIVASDGIETLDKPAIARVLNDRDGWAASDLADALLAAVEQASDPEQDNVSFTVIRPQIAAHTVTRKPHIEEPRVQEALETPQAVAVPRIRLSTLGLSLWRRSGSAPGDVR